MHEFTVFLKLLRDALITKEGDIAAMVRAIEKRYITL